MNWRDQLGMVAGLAGTCGTKVVPSLPRATEEEVQAVTAYLREDTYPGAIITACADLSDKQEEWLTNAGWVKCLTYRGQYTNYPGKSQNDGYPMTHWALVLKPWIEAAPKIPVKQKEVV